MTKIEKSKTLVWGTVGNKSDAKGIFVAVYLMLRNVGTRNSSSNTRDFELHDAAGIIYDTSFDGMYHFSTIRNLAELEDPFPPGLQLASAVVFDINPTAKGLTLYLVQAKAQVNLGQ